MVPLNNIRIRRRRSLRLTRAALTTLLCPRHRLRTSTLNILLLLPGKAPHASTLLARKLSTRRVSPHCAIALSSGLIVRDNVVRSPALAVRYLVVLLEVLGVLEDDVPCVQLELKVRYVEACDVGNGFGLTRPGRKPRQQSARLMSESAPQMPFFTQTVCC